jgi:hypothetical protein
MDILSTLDLLLTFMQHQHTEKLNMIERIDTMVAQLHADRKRIENFLGMTNDFKGFGAKHGMWEEARLKAFDGVDVNVRERGKEEEVQRAEETMRVMREMVVEVKGEVEELGREGDGECDGEYDGERHECDWRCHAVCREERHVCDWQCYGETRD